jgi:hypothetical protein
MTKWGSPKKPHFSKKVKMLSSSGIDTPSAGSQQDPPLFSNNSFNSQVRLKAKYFLSIAN